MTSEHTSALPKPTDISWQQIRKTNQLYSNNIYPDKQCTVSSKFHISSLLFTGNTNIFLCMLTYHNENLQRVEVLTLLVRGGNFAFRFTGSVFKQCSQGPLESNKVAVVIGLFINFKIK